MHDHLPGFYSYLVQRDLGTPTPVVTSPFDPRALFYFYRLAGIVVVKNLHASAKLLLSFEPAYSAGYGTPRDPQVQAVVDPGTELEMRVRASHVIAWFDPASPPAGSAMVRVSAL